MSKGVNTRHLAGGQNDCLGLGLVLGESQTRPRAEGIEQTVEIFSSFREVIRAATVIIVLSSARLLIRRGLSLPFFQIGGK